MNSVKKLYILLFFIITILFKELLNIDQVTLNSEMMVAKNCAIRINGHNNLTTEDLKK